MLYILWLLGVSLVTERIVAEARMHGRPSSQTECDAGNIVSVCWHAGCRTLARRLAGMQQPAISLPA